MRERERREREREREREKREKRERGERECSELMVEMQLLQCTLNLKILPSMVDNPVVDLGGLFYCSKNSQEPPFAKRTIETGVAYEMNNETGRKEPLLEYSGSAPDLLDM